MDIFALGYNQGGGERVEREVSRYFKEKEVSSILAI
jgi:hypothetical protein